MKYCVHYYKNFRYNDVIDEVVINYNNYDIVEKIQELNLKDSQRIIIDVCIGGEVSIIPTLQMCMKNHNNLVVRIDIIQEELVNALKDAGIPFFYANYANTFDEVYSMIKRGVSDIYITESLAFNIEKIGEYCKEKNINVRMIPNIAQYKKGFRNDIPDPYKFFVRPEDTKLYTPYVNVFEIIAPEDRLSIIYEIYKNEKWSGDLKQLIVGLDESFYNSGTLPLFGPTRLSCGHKCMLEKCSLCQQAKELADRFEENKLEVKVPKNKEWKYETESYKEAMRIAEKATAADDDKVSKE